MLGLVRMSFCRLTQIVIKNSRSVAFMLGIDALLEGALLQLPNKEA